MQRLIDILRRLCCGRCPTPPDTGGGDDGDGGDGGDTGTVERQVVYNEIQVGWMGVEIGYDA